MIIDTILTLFSSWIIAVVITSFALGAIAVIVATSRFYRKR